MYQNLIQVLRGIRIGEYMARVIDTITEILIEQTIVHCSFIDTYIQNWMDYGGSFYAVNGGCQNALEMVDLHHDFVHRDYCLCMAY